MSGYTEIVRELAARQAREEAVAPQQVEAPEGGAPVVATALLAAAPLLVAAAAAPVAAINTPLEMIRSR